MGSDWITVSLGEFAPLKYGKGLPEKRRNNKGQIPVYGSNGIIGRHDASYVNQPGIIIGRKGSVGNLQLSKEPFWPIDTTFYITNDDYNELMFTFYFLKTINLARLNTDSAVPGLNRENVECLIIKIPPRKDRKNIAEQLTLLDKKIALNGQLNRTLEALAQALFKNWFVDFGPVRAKMEGRPPPGLTEEVAALFPDALDREGKPVGWHLLALDQLADFLNGLMLQKYPGSGHDDLPVIKIAELRSGITKNSSRASRTIPLQYVVKDGDVLFSWSGSLMQTIWAGGPGALNQHLFKVTSKRFPKWLHHFWVDHYLPAFQAIAASKATTMGHIQRRHLAEAKIVLGDEALMEAANRIFAPIFQQIVTNKLQSHTLAALRDLLLPKLLSGEIQVKDAERRVKAVVWAFCRRRTLAGAAGAVSRTWLCIGA